MTDERLEEIAKRIEDELNRWIGNRSRAALVIEAKARLVEAGLDERVHDFSIICVPNKWDGAPEVAVEWWNRSAVDALADLVPEEPS